MWQLQEAYTVLNVSPGVPDDQLGNVAASMLHTIKVEQADLADKQGETRRVLAAYDEIMDFRELTRKYVEKWDRKGLTEEGSKRSSTQCDPSDQNTGESPGASSSRKVNRNHVVDVDSPNPLSDAINNWTRADDRFEPLTGIRVKIRTCYWKGSSSSSNKNGEATISEADEIHLKLLKSLDVLLHRGRSPDQKEFGPPEDCTVSECQPVDPTFMDKNEKGKNPQEEQQSQSSTTISAGENSSEDSSGISSSTMAGGVIEEEGPVVAIQEHQADVQTMFLQERDGTPDESVGKQDCGDELEGSQSASGDSSDEDECGSPVRAQKE
ncbi:hypothetical protein LTS08_000386 [Lithohypha guttulata]|nr:hypothetical protein LTS08_000386 [Lithohypha guttulata]